jgi:hypothetical protein
MLKEFNLKPYLKKRKNTKSRDSLDNKREIVIFPKYKKILIRNKKLNGEREREIEKANLKSSNIASSLSLDNSKKELINTIKNFITETSDEIYSDINTCPSPEQVHRNNKSNMLKRTVCKINNSKKSKLNNKSKNNINNLLFKRDNSDTYLSNIGHNSQRRNRNRLLDSNFSFNSLIGNCYSYNSDNNSLKNLKQLNSFNSNKNNIYLKNEIEGKMKEIKMLNLKINNITNKIELMKYDLNMNNNYFKQVNKQCLKVLYNSKTIKAIQKSFDKEIPKIKEEIEEIKNKLYLLRKENEMNNLDIINICKDIEMKKDEINDIQFINHNLKEETKNIKKNIFLIKSMNGNIKFLISKNIFN